MKFLYTYYFPETGKTITAIQGKDGKIFKGKAKLHPDDRTIESKFVGGRLSEERAYINFLKDQRRITIKQIEVIKKLKNDLHYRLNDEDIDPAIKRSFNLKLRDLNRYKEEIDTELEETKNLIKESIEMREKILNKGKSAGQEG